MNILIIGGTGLISTAITRQLLQRGDTVTHFNRGHTPVRLPAELPRPALVVGDRRNRAEFEERWALGPRFDVVLDMAAFTPDDAQSAVRAFTGRTATQTGSIPTAMLRTSFLLVALSTSSVPEGVFATKTWSPWTAIGANCGLRKPGWVRRGASVSFWPSTIDP
jgi:nucleoside-diphosphate-sugar epimerase